MPTYEYECEKCGHAFEVMQSIIDAKLKQCPECKKNTLHRLIGSGSAIIFKGSGFFETDYKRKKPAVDTCPSGKADTCPCACPAKGNKNS